MLLWIANLGMGGGGDPVPAVVGVSRGARLSQGQVGVSYSRRLQDPHIKGVGN